MEYYRNRYFSQHPPAGLAGSRAHHLIGDAIWMNMISRLAPTARPSWHEEQRFAGKVQGNGASSI